MSEASPRPVEKSDQPTIDVPRLDTSSSFAKEAYVALKRAITAMDVYDLPEEIRLDERRLSEGLGVSRTPIREAMTLLEQEVFVRTRPRRGIFVVRKTKRELVEMTGCVLLAEMTESLFIHMRAIRKITIHQDNRAARSVVDHMRIIEALERREPELAERLAREHTLGLAAHVEQHGDFLDPEGVIPAKAGIHSSGAQRVEK